VSARPGKPFTCFATGARSQDLFKSVLIANRGEFAVRIIRTARRLGLRCIAVYSEADARAMHVRLADEALCVGPAPSADSYLRQDVIVQAARKSGAECIHPGAGFLAENAEFAEACAAAGVVFVGPTPNAIRVMGLKDEAKAMAEKLGIPVVPGYAGEAQDTMTFAREAKRIGYPVVLKAVAGGGGKGLKPVFSPVDLPEAAASAQREALAAFGDSRLLMEKLIEPARHIEMQVFGDNHGNAVHLFERECTLQRRAQKVIEEAPAINLPEPLRARMADAALKAARAVGYRGAGTVEFLVPGGPMRDDTPFYFMEMNTRLQIEHPVTELITGLDLVEWQFRVAAGQPLPLAQDAIQASGAAVEARLYAEDPATGFLPSPGRIYKASFPQGPGVRVDTGVETGAEVPPYYDAMIAKIIGHGATRAQAYANLLGALDDTILAGPRTNLDFLHRLGERSAERGELLSTRFIERHLQDLTAPRGEDGGVIEAGAVALVMRAQADAARQRRAVSSEPQGPWDALDGFEYTATRSLSYDVVADGEPHRVTLSWAPDGVRAASADAKPVEVIEAGDEIIVWHNRRQVRMRWPERKAGGVSGGANDGALRSPMPGRLAKLLVQAGDQVARGDRMAIVEAMKMEHVLHAPADAIVVAVPRAEGEQVELGTVIAELKAVGRNAASD
jgi:3-methylcrotonyl-CoA carboxylase alpha subunit